MFDSSLPHKTPTRRWKVHDDSPPWMHTTIMDSILTLSHLEDFQLQLTLCRDTSLLFKLDNLSPSKKISIQGQCHCSNFQPDITTGLTRVISRSPQLTHLEVDIFRFGSHKTATAHDLLRKVPLGRPLRLTHLRLRDIPIQTPLDNLIIIFLCCPISDVLPP